MTNDVPSHDAITHQRFVCINVRDEDIALFGDVALVHAGIWIAMFFIAK